MHIHRAAGQISERQQALLNNYFEDLDPDLSKEGESEYERREEHKQEDCPKYDISFHRRIVLSGLVVEARVDRHYDHKEGHSFQPVKTVIIIRL